MESSTHASRSSKQSSFTSAHTPSTTHYSEKNEYHQATGAYQQRNSGPLSNPNFIRRTYISPTLHLSRSSLPSSASQSRQHSHLADSPRSTYVLTILDLLDALPTTHTKAYAPQPHPASPSRLPHPSIRTHLSLPLVRTMASRGGRGGAPSRGGAQNTSESNRPRKESILDLQKYADKSVIVKFSGGREIQGTLKGFDGLMNLVLDDVVEVVRGKCTLVLVFRQGSCGRGGGWGRYDGSKKGS